ncbi:MAG: hypothetical protein EAX81_08395 [Candidatus Thorarchaeota archaeon]|nr:hypothetical protein [Candidatus Thorarchaeota archaeon]
MKANKNLIEGIVKLGRIELALSYRIPLIESMAAIVAYTSCISVFMVIFQTIGLNLVLSDTLYNGPENVGAYQQIISERATMSYALAQTSCWTFFTILVPLFFAFTLARAFEDGTLRTLMSYPISRTMLLTVKTLVFIIVISIPVILIPLLLIATYLPSEAIVNYLGLFIISTLLSVAQLSVTSILLSVLSKDAATTAVVGVLLWVGLSYLSSLPTIPIHFLMLCSPIKMLSNYAVGLYPEMINWELLFLLLGSLAFVAALFIIGIRVFRRVEI